MRGFMRKIICIVLMLVVVIQLFTFKSVFAVVDDTPQTAPENLRLNDGTDKPIGYNEAEGYYIDIKWDAIFPDSAVNRYINIYMQEIDQTPMPRKLVAKDVPGSQKTYRLKNLKSGTVYYIDLTAYHTHTDANGVTYSSGESVPSVRLKVMTDIKVAAFSYGTHEIKIEWDDVWDTGGRIEYKLYVSENSDFSNTPPIYIDSSQIGQSAPVKVNSSTGKLEYIHKVRDPGRVYYVKIVPDIMPGEIKRNPEDEVVLASSYILAKTTKMSQTDAGVVWRLDWSPVVTGLNDSDLKISYQIYRGNSQIGDVPQYVASVSGTNYFITLPLEGDHSYYIIRANVTKNGQEVYPGLKIQSDRIIVKESEIPAEPPAPELVDELRKVDGDVIISYNDLLKPDGAVILWRMPLKGDGTIDEDMFYDIWLINDPNFIDNPQETSRLETSFQITAENRVNDGMNAIGCKYVLTGLKPNSTYYFKITAKKRYVDYIDGKLQEIWLTSQPALKIVKTPPQGKIEQPLIPSRPPLKVKELSDGRHAVTSTSVIIQLKNAWYEKYNNGRWEYVKTEKLSPNDTVEYDPVRNPPDDINYRKVAYDEGITLNVGYVKYESNMSYSDISKIPADKITGFPITANDASEDPLLNPPDQVNPPVYNKHNVDIPITGLEPNTTYIIWVRASRDSAGLMSGPSDPIVVTTLADVEQQPEKPTVPEFSYGDAGDTYVDLVWNYDLRYNYYIKYATEDNPDAAGEAVNVTPQQLMQKSSFRIDGLNPDTTYYFWIQAEKVNYGNNPIKSDWSDSIAVKTLPPIPPETPRGFGVKDSVDAVKNNSITYEWLPQDGLQYIIEVADNSSYTDSKEYRIAEKASSYTVEGLRSNYRYFARLYAYDPEKDLRSIPTQSVIVRTARSNDEYDSDQDIDNPASGEFVVKDDEVRNLTWTAKITGINAARFIDHVQNDRVVDYRLDMTNPPSKADRIVVNVSGKVFYALNTLKENFIIDTQKCSVVIRPKAFLTGIVDDIKKNDDDFEFQIIVSTSSQNNTPDASGLVFKTGIVNIQINAVTAGNTYSVGAFAEPVRVEMPYTDSGWYQDGKTSAVIYNPLVSQWESIPLGASYSDFQNGMYLYFDIMKPGSVAIAEMKNKIYDDIQGTEYEDAIMNVSSLCDLKSIKGMSFEPYREASIGEAVKLMLDVLGSDYGNDFMQLAAKSGIIPIQDIDKPNSKCSREKAIAMVVRVYEIKSGKRVKDSNASVSIFKDFEEVSPGLASKVAFAIENGMVLTKDVNILAPREIITRGEIMYMLEKMLALNGEL